MAISLISNLLFRNNRMKFTKELFMKNAMSQSASQKGVSKQLELFTAAKFSKQQKQPLMMYDDANRPLVVLIAWLMANKKHVQKYSEIYLKKGFDVLTVSMTPWQFLWPTTGAQLLAGEILNYLNENSRQPLLLHGFSSGAYLWGEVLVKMNMDLPKYTGLINRVKGQIWDSAPDIAELHTGIPRALVPNNGILQATLQKYITCHLNTFQDSVTKHYIRSSQMLHSTPIRAPIMIFICKNDHIATEESNLRVKESWESLGIRVHMKCWDKSKHVSHFIIHRDEYLAELNSFVGSLDFYPNAQEVNDKLKAKL